MPRERTQLNINIDPELLLRLKSESIKNGKTLTEYVTQRLENIPTKSTNETIEKRLANIEEHLNLNKSSSDQVKQIGTIFSDEGAKKYGDVAKALFELHLKKKAISPETGLQQLTVHLRKYPNSSPELIFQILLGNYELTGLEMTNAYRSGSSAMRSALTAWCDDPLEALNEAFLNAVITKSLA